jgi:hypothetical protein
VLRHNLAEASIKTLDAERTLVLKEMAVSKSAARRWEKSIQIITGSGSTPEQRQGDPKYCQIEQRVRVAHERLQR